MSGNSEEYAFPAPVLRTEERLRHHYVPLPNDVADALKEACVRRVLGRLNGHAFDRAVHQKGDGQRYLMFGYAALRRMGVRVGDVVEIELRPDPDPDSVPLCQELTEVLNQDPDAGRIFGRLPPGIRRSITYYVDSARRVETRIGRALFMANKIKTDPFLRDR